MNPPVGVYISVPFCKAKCTFCNFASGVFAADRIQGYVDRLCTEVRGARAASESLLATLDHRADSVYFGGGTPSLLSPGQFDQIFSALRSEFDLAANAEITLECAPGQLSGETLDELLRQGMNRISFGVQSFVDRESAAVGRLHTRQHCEAEIARVRAAGIHEINLDLIAGLPYQTEASWRYSIEQAIASGAPHVSVYMLEVDEESRLGKEMLTNGTRYHASAVPSEDEAAAWYQLACESFDAAGLRQYEISNFAQQGHPRIAKGDQRFAVAALVIAGLLIAACGSSSSGQQSQIRVAFFAPIANTYVAATLKGMNEVSASGGFKITQFDTGFDANRAF